jgi:very-short-patch-repair endonuclease
MADGRPGILTHWLRHCTAVQASGRPKPVDRHVGQVDSEFEAEVAVALRAQGLFVLHQYPACGFHIDLVCEKDEVRVAVECDGERYHIDEHGQPKVEDLEREAILRRAGWRVLRVPYRKWLRDPEAQVNRVLGALEEERRDRLATENEVDIVPDVPPVSKSELSPGTPSSPVRPIPVTRSQEAIVRVMREGISDQERLLYRVRDLLGVRRLTGRLRDALLADMTALGRQGLVTVEDHEYFLTPLGKAASLAVVHRDTATATGWRRRRRRPYRRRW